MTFHRLTLLIAVVMLSLFVAACNGDSPAAPVENVTPAAQEATPTEPAEQPESPLLPPCQQRRIAVRVAEPAADKTVITGRLINSETSSAMANQNLSLPAVLCAPGVAEADKREQCFYMIDEAFDPSTLTDGDGRFVFQDIPAGEYVLMVGNLMTEYTVLTDELNRPLIWKGEAGQTLDAGDLVVDLR